MPTITRLPVLPLRRLRAEPNQLILHFRGGRLVRKGAGMAYWFSPLSAAIAMLPIEDCQSTFVLNEHTADFQSIKVQSTISYRIVDAEKAASRFNFSLSIDHGAWLEQPLDRLASVLAMARHTRRGSPAGTGAIRRKGRVRCCRDALPR